VATRYRLIDSDNNTYDLTDETFKLMTDDYGVEVDLIEKSFQAGAVFTGVQRDESKELSFTYEIYYDDDTSFTLAQNELIKQFRKAVKLRDIILERETEVYYNSLNIKYIEGSQYRGAQVTVNFNQVLPYWEELSYRESTLSGITSGQIIINNDGYTETPPIITISTLTTVSNFSIELLENSRGIIIKDNQFGGFSLSEYVIDCKAGTFLLSGIDRSQLVKQGTGPFNLILGTNTLEFVSNDLIDVKVQWKKRYYI
jgi:hypothetical protein